MTYIGRYSKSLLVWFLLGTMPLGIWAQDRYRTDLLGLIAKKTGICQQIDTLKDGEYTQFTDYKSDPVTIIVEKGRITHIGYSLFSTQQRKGFGADICNFIERYLLELAIPTNDIFSASQRMKEDGVRVVKGNMELKDLRQLCADTTVCINLQNLNEQTYTMGWRKDSTWLYILSFPIEYDLMFGTDMDERERRLSEEVINSKIHNDSFIDSGHYDMVKAWQDNYYTLKGDSYLLANLNSNLYFTKNGEEKYIPIYNNLYPIESLANLLTSNLIDNDYTLEIMLRKYGFKTDTINVPLKQWISFCKDSGCKPFFGIISFEKDGITTCELIMHHDKMGYNHIMKLAFPMSNFESRKGRISARLNSYVTSSRIKNLFDDY